MKASRFGLGSALFVLASGGVALADAPAAGSRLAPVVVRQAAPTQEPNRPPLAVLPSALNDQQRIAQASQALGTPLATASLRVSLSIPSASYSSNSSAFLAYLDLHRANVDFGSSTALFEGNVGEFNLWARVTPKFAKAVAIDLVVEGLPNPGLKPGVPVTTVAGANATKPGVGNVSNFWPTTLTLGGSAGEQHVLLPVNGLVTIPLAFVVPTNVSSPYLDVKIKCDGRWIFHRADILPLN